MTNDNATQIQIENNELDSRQGSPQESSPYSYQTLDHWENHDSGTMTQMELESEQAAFFRMLQGIAQSSSVGNTAPKETSIPKRRVHIPEVILERRDDGICHATNGGLFEIEICGDDEKTFEIVRANERPASADDLRAVRNLIIDLEGVQFPSMASDRIPYWKWKAQVILRILEHPAMEPDSNPGISPDFDRLGWEENFLAGMTVEEAYQSADDAFNKMGW